MTTIITTEKIKSSDKIGITEPLIKPPRLTKKGKIDKRSITSKKNLEKGVKYVKEIIDKARALHPKNCDDIESDTEEYEIILKKDPIPVPVSIPVSVTTGLSEVNVIKENSPKNIKGSGFIEDTDKFLKNTKLLSKVGQAVLPFALGALGTTFSPLGTATGLAVAQAGVEGLKNYGYGKMSGGACYSQGQLPPNKEVPRGKLSGAGGNFQGTTYANRRNIGVFPVVPPLKGGTTGKTP